MNSKPNLCHIGPEKFREASEFLQCTLIAFRAYSKPTLWYISLEKLGEVLELFLCTLSTFRTQYVLYALSSHNPGSAPKKSIFKTPIHRILRRQKGLNPEFLCAIAFKILIEKEMSFETAKLCRVSTVLL